MKISKLESYHKIAQAIAENSPDEQTKVGSLLIKKDTGAILGSSYNGFIRGGPDSMLPKTRPGKYKYIIHSELNLIAHSAMHGVSTDGCFVYCTLSPCINCLRALYQAGIEEIYFKEKYRDFEENCIMKDLKLNIRPLSEGLLFEDDTEGDFYKLRTEPK